MLLFVRLHDRNAEEKALRILSEYSKWEVKVHEITPEHHASAQGLVAPVAVHT
jgi:hypothetical protein